MPTLKQKIADLKATYVDEIEELEKAKQALSGKVTCTVDAIEKALGGGGSEFGSAYGYRSGYGRQRKAMVGYRTPRRRRRY